MPAQGAHLPARQPARALSASGLGLLRAPARAPSAWCWSGPVPDRQPFTRRRTSLGYLSGICQPFPVPANCSPRARCQPHHASRTAVAVRSCADSARLATARDSASASAPARERSPGSQSGMATPATYSRLPSLRLRRSVFDDSSSDGDSAVQLSAVCRRASAASRRSSADFASGWRCQAASNACGRELTVVVASLTLRPVCACAAGTVSAMARLQARCARPDRKGFRFFFRHPILR
jgi:hypothetical protein